MATTETTDTQTNTGRIEEIQGVVVEVTFPNGELPEIYNAITVARGEGDDAAVLVLEVQQHLGDDRVRCVAMDSTDGLSRGMGSSTPAGRSPCPSARACSAGS